MQATDIVQIYFDAWDAHNPAAILDLFEAQGTYSDPTTNGDLSGQAIADYAKSLFNAFPDLRLELICNQVTTTGNIAAPWIFHGVNSGPLGEQAATHRKIALPGCDFICVNGNKIQSVHGLFSVDELMRQLSG